MSITLPYNMYVYNIVVYVYNITVYVYNICL